MWIAALSWGVLDLCTNNSVFKIESVSLFCLGNNVHFGGLKGGYVFFAYFEEKGSY